MNPMERRDRLLREVYLATDANSIKAVNPYPEIANRLGIELDTLMGDVFYLKDKGLLKIAYKANDGVGAFVNITAHGIDYVERNKLV